MPTFVILASLLAGCSNEVPGESRVPRCEPRSNMDPARLNIDSSAEDFALSDPCRAAIQFYIAGHTDVRTVAGEIDFTDVDGEHVVSESFELKFPSPRAGMLSETIALFPIDGHTCRQLLGHLPSLTCRDAEDDELECPPVRLKTSYVLEDLTIETGDLDVCFD